MTDRSQDSAATACIVHDVTNLLSAIMAAADAALARPTDPECRADLLQIRDNARRSAVRLRRLLPDGGHPAAHHDAPELHAQSIDPAIEAIADTLRHVAGPDVRLEITYGAPDQLVLLDTDGLHDALLNLTTNARDAMDGRGTLTLHTSVQIIPATDRYPAGRYAAIELRDSGPGIPPKLRQQVFEPFFTTKQPGHGSGLGLYAVRETARRHDGFVVIDDAPGGGTVVRVCLRTTDEKPLDGKDRLVLLAEDEPTLRRLVLRALTGQGWRVMAAEDGEALLILLSRDLMPQDRPALVISDVALPGLGGPALVQAVRQTWPGLPAILVSGYARASLPTALDRVSFLRKPFTIADLTMLVASVAEMGIAKSGMAESGSSCIVLPRPTRSNTMPTKG